MFFFTTKSGSNYQVDPIQKFFRKVGENWKKYDDLEEDVAIGSRARFYIGEKVYRTSRVTDIKPCEAA